MRVTRIACALQLLGMNASPDRKIVSADRARSTDKRGLHISCFPPLTRIGQCRGTITLAVLSKTQKPSPGLAAAQASSARFS